MRSLLLVVFLTSTALPAAAVPNNWIGGAAGDWNTSTNWSLGTVPGVADDAAISAAYVIAYATNTAPSVNSLDLSAGAVLLTYSGATAVGSVQLQSGAGLQFGATAPFSVGALTLFSGSSVAYVASPVAAGTVPALALQAGQFTLAAGATVTVSGRGFSGGALSAGGSGPGAGGVGGGISGGGGGGHAGGGGTGGGAANAGSAYDAQPPSQAGSGGGGSASSVGGSGGGLLAIYATTATIDGLIEADGIDGEGAGGFGAGGGAGGGIVILTQVLNGAGRLSASGGAGGTAISRGGGGAGGGFIWIRETSGWSVLRSTLTLQVNAGAAGGGAVVGIAGVAGALYADPRHWSGGGSGGLATDALNWNLGLLPVDGQRIVFGSSSTSVACLWDLNSVSVGSAALVATYRSSVLLNVPMAITGTFSMAGGTMTSSPGLYLSVGGDLSQSGGRIDFSGSSLTLAGIGASVAASFSDARVGILNISGLAAATATVTGALTVADQINLAGTSTLSLSTGTIRFEGDGPFVGGGSVNASTGATFAAAGISTQTWTPWPGVLGRLRVSNTAVGGLRLVVGNGGTFALMGGVLVDTATTLTVGASRLEVRGGWDSYGTQTMTGSTVAFRATTGTQTVAAGGNFDNVNVDNAGAVLQLSTRVVIAGRAVIQSGTFNLSNSNLSVRGDWTESLGAVVLGGTNISVFDGSRPQTITQLVGNSFGTFRAANTAQITISSTLTTMDGFHWDAGNLVYTRAKLTIGGDMMIHSGIILTVTGSTVIFNGTGSTQTINFPTFGDVVVAHYGPYGAYFTANANVANFKIMPGAVFNGGTSIVTVAGSSYDTALSTYYATNATHQVLWQPTGPITIGAGSVVNAKLTLDTGITAILLGDLNVGGAGTSFDIRTGATLVAPVGGSTIAFRGSADFRPSAGGNWTYAGDVANSWLVFEGSGTHGAFLSTTTIGTLRVSLNTSSDTFRAPNLNITKHLVHEGGTLSPSGAVTINVGGDFLQTGGVIDFGTASTGTVALVGSSRQTLRLRSGAHALWHFTDLNASTVTLTSDMLARGDFVVSTGLFRAGSGNVRLQGTVLLSTAASFSSQGSTVTLDGASGGRPSQTMAFYGSGTFDGLATNVPAATLLTPTTATVFTDATAGTLTFAAGAQFTFADFHLAPVGGGLLRVQSSNPGSPWYLKVTSVSSVTATTAVDSDASRGRTIEANDGRSVDGGGNVNWNFFSQILVLLPGETFTPTMPPGKTGVPLVSTAGVPITITVLAVSSRYDLSTSTGIVTLTSDDAYASLGGPQVLSTGSTAFLVTPYVAEPSPRSTHFIATTNFGSGLSTGSIIPSGLSRLQIIMPGEVATPGSVTGHSGYAWPRVRGIAFAATVRAVDSYWNIIDMVTHSFALRSSASSATLPSPPALVGGTANVGGFIFFSTGLFTINATDITQFNVLSATSSVFGVTPPSISSPTAAFYIPNGASVATLSGFIAGTASDSSSISLVRVDLTELETGFHFDGGASFLSAVAVFSTSTLAAPLSASTSWSNPIPDSALASGRHYAAVAIVEDPTGFFGVTSSTFVVDRSALSYGARSGQGSATMVASSTSGCQVITASLTYVVAGAGINPGGAVAVRVPAGWSLPVGVTSQNPPLFGYWTVISTSQVGVIGSSIVTVSPAAFGTQALGAQWLLLQVATNSAASFLPGEQISFVYTGMPPLSRGGRGVQTFGLWSTADATAPLAPISTQPFISLNAGQTRLVAFKEQDPLNLGPAQRSQNMQLKVVDQCGNDNLGVSSGAATLAVVVANGAGFTVDSGAIFMSSSNVVISTVILPLNVSYSQMFSVTTSTNAPLAYLRASVVFPVITTNTAVIAMRAIALPGSSETFMGASIDTGTLIAGATSAILSSATPDAYPMRITFTLSDPDLSWDAILSTDAVNFGGPVFRANGFGDATRPITLVWDGVDRITNVPPRMAPAGHYRLRLRAGGGVSVDSTLEAVVPQTAGYAGRLGAAAAGAQVRALGPGAGEGAFAVASSTGYFVLQGLRTGQAYLLFATTATRVGSIGVTLSSSIAAPAATWPVADLGSITMPSAARLRLAAMLSVPSPFDAIGGYVGRYADGSVAFAGPLRFSTGAATSDDAGPLFGRAASTWSAAYAAPGIYNIEVDVPDLRISTTIANLNLGSSGIDFFIPLSKVAGATGWVVLPSTISAPLTVSIQATRGVSATPTAFMSVLISSSPPLVGASSAPYVLYGLEPGTWSVRASAAGFLSTAATIIVADAIDVAAPDLTLGIGGSIVGTLRVLGDSGAATQCYAGSGGAPGGCPTGGFDVAVEALALSTLDRGSTRVRMSSSSISSQASFTITGLTPGLWTLHATLPGFSLYPASGVVVSVPTVGTSSATVSLNRADARARVTAQLPTLLYGACRSTTTWTSLGLTLETADGLARIYGDATAITGGGAFAQYGCSSATFFTPALPPGALRVAGLYLPSGTWAFGRTLLIDGTTASLTLDLTASSVSARGSLAVSGPIAITTMAAGVPYSVIATSAAGVLSAVPGVALCHLGSKDPFIRPTLRAELIAYENAATAYVLPRAPGGVGSCAALNPSSAAVTAVAITAPIAADGSFSFSPGVQPGHYLLRIPGDLDGDPRNGNEAVEYSQLITIGAGGVTLQPRLGRGWRVSGTLSAPPGLPAGRQFRVALIGIGGVEVRAAIVAPPADGAASFDFDGIADGGYSWAAEDVAATRAWAAPTRVVTVAGADVTGLRLSVAPAGVIRARIAVVKLQPDGTEQVSLITHEDAGLLPPGFKAVLYSGNRAFPARIAPDGSIVDALGRLVFDGLPAGLYDAMFSAPTSAAALGAGSLALAPARVSAVSVAEGQAVDLGVVVMFAGTLVSGRVTDIRDASAVAELRVCARPSATGGAAPGAVAADLCAETDASGRYLLRGLDPSAHWFDVTAAPRGILVSGQALPPYAMKRALSVDVSSGAVVDFALSPAASTIIGRIAGATGLLLTSSLGPSDEIAPGAAVTLQAGGVSPGDDPAADLALRTLPDGSFVIPAVAIGSYRLTATAVGQGSVVRSVVVTTASVDLGVLNLGAGASLSGALRMPDGSAPANREVTAIAALTPDSSEFVYGALRPDPTGASVVGYSFGGLSIGKVYRVLIIDSGGFATVPPEAGALVLTSSVTARVLNLTLRPAPGPVAMRGTRNGSLWNISARFPSPIRSRYSSDSDASLILATAAATGALTEGTVMADRLAVTAVYNPGMGESSAVFQASAPLAAIDWNSTSPTGRELIASATTLVQLSGDGFSRATLMNGLGGALTLDGDGGRVVLPRGAFGVDAASAVAVTFTRAVSPAVYAAAAPVVTPAGPYYDVSLAAGLPATLARPAQLTLSYSTAVADPARLHVYWWNPAARAYILTADAAGSAIILDRSARTVTLNVRHFSTYVLLDSGLASIVGSDYGGGQLDAYNFPNPFDLSVKTVTTIHGGGSPAVRGTLVRVSVPPELSGGASLRVFDVTGRIVRTIDLGTLAGGRVYYQAWDGRNDGGSEVASGLYIGLIDVGGKRKTFKMAVLK